MKKDSNNNIYEDVSNIRITYKKQSNRASDKDWSETDVISFRAYKGEESDAMHIGTELALVSNETIVGLIAALCRLYMKKDE